MFSKTSRPESEVEQDAVTTDAMEASTEDAVETTADMAQIEQDDWQFKYNQLQDQYTRLAADFENFRKRVREEQESLAKYGAQKTVLELLPVLDNLERASSSLSENSDPKVLFRSFEVVQKQLMDRLDTLGVKKIIAVGQEFDPQYHEAVNQMESAEFPENTVMYEAQSGYTLQGKVIRPAMVVVSTGSAGEAPQSTEATADAPVQEDAGSSNPFRQ